MSIFVPLAEEPYTNFCTGAKTVEVRNAKSPVAAQVRKAQPDTEVRLRWGYGPHGALGILERKGRLGRTWEGLADEMPDWVKAGACINWQRVERNGYFDPGGRILAFEALGAAQPGASA